MRNVQAQFIAVNVDLALFWQVQSNRLDAPNVPTDVQHVLNLRITVIYVLLDLRKRDGAVSVT